MSKKSFIMSITRISLMNVHDVMWVLHNSIYDGATFWQLKKRKGMNICQESPKTT